MTGTTIIATCVIFALVLTGMAVGVIFSNRRIKGSCGGIANLRDEHGNVLCESCSNPSRQCREALEQRQQEEQHEEAGVP